MALFLAGPLAAADGENAGIGEALEPAVGSLGGETGRGVQRAGQSKLNSLTEDRCV
jgi:hypothetical protein